MKKFFKNPGKLAGVAILLIAVAAAFAYGYVWPQFGSSNQALLWEDQQRNALWMFQAAGAWFVIGVLDLIVTWGLYHHFAEQSQPLSRVSALFRLTYTFILFIAIVQLYNGLPALELENGSEDLQSALTSFETYWSVGLIVFGLHLFSLGALMRKPKWLRVLLYVAGASYVLVHFGLNFMPHHSNLFLLLESILAAPMAIAELSLAVWLILKK